VDTGDKRRDGAESRDDGADDGAGEQEKEEDFGGVHSRHLTCTMDR